MLVGTLKRSRVGGCRRSSSAEVETHTAVLAALVRVMSV